MKVVARLCSNTVLETQSLVSSEIQARHHPDEDMKKLTCCLLWFSACLKDLKRFWRLDEKDADRTVARIFFEVGILKNDLIPILTSTLGTSEKGDRIALACGE